jgi:hypothetical protein
MLATTSRPQARDGLSSSRSCRAAASSNGANSITYEIISSPPERILDTSLLGSSKTGNVKALTRPYANLALTVTPALEFGFAFEPGLMSQIVRELGVLRGHT